jgi:hypothetical protein
MVSGQAVRNSTPEWGTGFQCGQTSTRGQTVRNRTPETMGSVQKPGDKFLVDVALYQILALTITIT